MLRRTFLTSLLSVLGLKKTSAQEKDQLKTLYRKNDQGVWVRIQWSEAQPGDTVLILLADEKQVSTLEFCKVTEPGYILNKGVDSLEISHNLTFIESAWQESQQWNPEGNLPLLSQVLISRNMNPVIWTQGGKGCFVTKPSDNFRCYHLSDDLETVVEKLQSARWDSLACSFFYYEEASEPKSFLILNTTKATISCLFEDGNPVYSAYKLVGPLTGRISCGVQPVCPICAEGKSNNYVPVHIKARTDTGVSYQCPVHGRCGLRYDSMTDRDRISLSVGTADSAS